MIHTASAPSPRSMVPIFAVGGTVSGYASMGSVESYADKMLDARHHVVLEALEKVRDPGKNEFRSQFAKELNEQRLSINEIKIQQDRRNNVNSFNSLIDVPHPQEAKYSKSDMMILKLENKQLKLKIEECLIEEGRYRNMQHELEQLTQKLSKVTNCQIQSHCM